MWKALVVFFVVTGHQPPGIMVGEFHDIFTSEAECKAFLVSKEAGMAASIERINTDPKVIAAGESIIGHKLDCVEDKSGEET